MTNKLFSAFIYGISALTLLLAITVSAPAATVVHHGTIGTFSGPGDLNLNADHGTGAHNDIFINVNGPTLDVDGVTFLSDIGIDPSNTQFNVIADTGIAVPGGWGTKPEYGTSVDEDNLETIMHSIRHTVAREDAVQIDLSVVPGRDYELFLLTGENRDPGDNRQRTWDIEVEGQLVVDEYNSSGNDPVMNSVNQSGFYSGIFTAADDILNISMGEQGGETTAGLDRNPIIQAVILHDLTGGPAAPPLPGPPPPPAANTVLSTTVGTFTGGDAGEGLDLDGNFPYALNIRGPGGATVRDANFTDDGVDGVSVSAPNEIINWHSPDYGDTSNDDGIEEVMQSIRWNTGVVEVELDNLVPDGEYKLQLMFAESCCDRGFDVVINGELASDDFNIQATQGAPLNNTAVGALITYEFLAGDERLNIQLTPDGAFPDNNPILNGLTLEAVPEPSSIILSAFGLLGLLAYAFRRRH